MAREVRDSRAMILHVSSFPTTHSAIMPGRFLFVLFPTHAREKSAAGYCEAAPILVQQRPCASMRLILGVHFC